MCPWELGAEDQGLERGGQNGDREHYLSIFYFLHWYSFLNHMVLNKISAICMKYV